MKGLESALCLKLLQNENDQIKGLQQRCSIDHTFQSFQSEGGTRFTKI